MSTRHNSVRQYTLGEFAMEQERLHREMLREHLREEKLNSLKLKVKIFWDFDPCLIYLNKQCQSYMCPMCVFWTKPFLFRQLHFQSKQQHFYFFFFLILRKTFLFEISKRCCSSHWCVPQSALQGGCLIPVFYREENKGRELWKLLLPGCPAEVWMCQEENESPEPLHSALLDKGMVTS